METRERIHYTDRELLQPTNPISVNLIGAGGTGSKVLTSLMEMNHSLCELGHPGLQVRLWDDDKVSNANLGRQLFASSEIGLYKSVALINRVNRFSGTNWKAETRKFNGLNSEELSDSNISTIYITAVDNVSTRFEVSKTLNSYTNQYHYRNQPKYWLDFGNSQYTGQVFLSTIGEINQPDSKKYTVVPCLPMITEEYGELLKTSELNDNTPSCSLAEALEKQDLFINSSLTTMGCSLLWNLFRNGRTSYRGFFLNLKDFRSQPVPV